MLLQPNDYIFTSNSLQEYQSDMFYNTPTTVMHLSNSSRNKNNGKSTHQLDEYAPV